MTPQQKPIIDAFFSNKDYLEPNIITNRQLKYFTVRSRSF